MKKFFAMLVVAAMLASLCALTANAAVDESEWSPFGEVTAEYKEDLSQFITLDGDVSDWQAHPDVFKRYDIDQYNLDAWVGEVAEGWSINLWFSADAEFLYIAFKINDPDVQFSSDNGYDKDAFQIQLDFKGWAAATEEFERAVFYSFGLQEDGTVDMTVQCIEGDAGSSVDYTMASDDEEEWREGHVMGATKKAEDGSGWYAEFAISWQTLYNDISEKLTGAELEVPAWEGSDDVSLNMLVCYLDHDTNEDGSDAGIKGAWGTSAALGSLAAADGWYPENAGMVLTLSGMGSMTVATTEAPTEEPTTEAPTTNAPETNAPEADASSDAATTDAPTSDTEPAGTDSCKALVAMPVVALVAMIGVAFVAKKKD